MPRRKAGPFRNQRADIEQDAVLADLDGLGFEQFDRFGTVLVSRALSGRNDGKSRIGWRLAEAEELQLKFGNTGDLCFNDEADLNW